MIATGAPSQLALTADDKTPSATLRKSLASRNAQIDLEHPRPRIVSPDNRRRQSGTLPQASAVA